MDDLLPRMLSFPPHPPPPKPLSDEKYDEGIKAQIAFMQQKTTTKHILDHTSGGESTLNVINPALNTVPYLFTLSAQLTETLTSNSTKDTEWLWAKICNFMSTFDARQVRYLGAQLEKILHDSKAFARRLGQPSLAIAPLRDCILRIDPTGSLLTSNHLMLVKLALDTQCFEEAIPVVEKPILYFPATRDQPKPKFQCDLTLPASAFLTSNSNLTTKLRHLDVLEYFLYSGMVFIGLRKWKKALECLENAMAYPTKESACSKIMVTAYKKWILVSLLLVGKPLTLPRITNSGAAKTYHTLAKPYETVAQLFETASASRLKSEIDIGAKLWQDDCNTGLMLEVLAAYQKFQIRRLADIYSKISIPEIVSQTMSAESGNRISAEAVEALIQEMIREGTLHATLSQSPNKPSILTFKLGGPNLSEVDFQRELAAYTKQIHQLNQDIKVTDRMLTHDKDYIKYAAKQKKSKGGSGSGGDLGLGDMDWNAMEEEDLMNGGF